MLAPIWLPTAAAEATPDVHLIIPDPRWEMPALLEPGRKPVGSVVIDWEHPLARGLIFFNMPGNGPHQYENLAKGQTQLNDNLASASDTVPHDSVSVSGNNLCGSGGHFDSTNGARSTTGFSSTNGFDITQPHTLAAVAVKPPNDLVAGDLIVPVFLATDSRYRYSMLVLSGDDNPLQRETRFIRRFTGSNEVGVSIEEADNGGLVAGDPIAMVGVLYSSTDIQLFLSNGVSAQSTSSHSGGPYYLREISVGEGRRDGAAISNYPATPNGSEVLLSCAWDRALSESEAKSFNANPYQFLLPA